jgi:hypothetical protein
MMLDWNGYREQVLATVTELARTSPDTVRGYRQLSDAGNKKNLLGAKTRELIALAVAVTRQCDAVSPFTRMRRLKKARLATRSSRRWLSQSPSMPGPRSCTRRAYSTPTRRRHQRRRSQCDW